MKRITKFWGVGLVLVMLVSLLVAAIPAYAADPLQVNSGSSKLPSTSDGKLHLINDVSIEDFAIANDGTTIYAVGHVSTSDNSVLYTSTDGGWNWTENSASSFSINNTDLVAVAPDNPSVVVVVDTTSATKAAYYSSNGGTRWTSLGEPADVGGNGANAIYDVDISPQTSSGIRYVVCSGRGAAADGGDDAIYMYDLGSVAPDWVNIADGEGSPSWTAPTDTEVDAVFAFEFSPNFLSDYSAVAVTETVGSATKNGTIALNFVNFNTRVWNSLDEYPVTLESSLTTDTVNTMVCVKADLALAPDYMGGDEAMRIAYVGASITRGAATEAGGIYRFLDTREKDLLSGTGINSVDFNGSALVAGAYVNNNVYRCADPLATTPTVLSATSYKRVGFNADNTAPDDTDDKTLVAWNGENVLGAKQEAGAAFSISYDSGKSWNDISLIDCALTDLDDIWLSADASARYLATSDGTVASVFRYKDSKWERVLVTADATYMLRTAPENSDVLYVATVSGTNMYYTADAGQTRWYPRSTATAADVAVESASVVYVATSGNIQKSVNNGFIWGSSKDVFPKTADSVNSLRSLGENLLIAGGSAGAVAYSTDGGSTWTQVTTGGATDGGNIVVTASGLESGDYIYATGNGTAGATISRFQIGTDTTWKDVAPGDALGRAYGIELVGGTLYVLTTVNGTDTEILRNMSPTSSTPSTSHYDVIGDSTYTIVSNQTPPVFRITTGSTIMWFVDNASPDKLYYYEDTLADAGPMLSAPADGTLVQMNAVSGSVYNVPLQWERPSLATTYKVYVALDSKFSQKVVNGDSVSHPTSSYIVNSSNAGLQPGTTYYWRVKVSGPISSPYSETRTFTVQPAVASVPGVASPANGGVIDNTSPAFSWTPVGGATKYEFQLSEGTIFAAPIFTAELDNTGIQPAVTLDRGKTYFWRVRAIEPVQGDWSAISNFTVAEEAPAPTPPVVVEEVPAPVINIPEAPPAQVIEIPPQPPVEKIAPAYIWAIIIIGAVLVIAIIVLIVRTRRTV